MNEEKANVIVEAIDIIADMRSRQHMWEVLGKAGDAATCSEDACRAMQLLKEALMKEDTHE